MVTWPDTLPPRSNTNGFADAVSNPRLMTRYRLLDKSNCLRLSVKRGKKSPSLSRLTKHLEKAAAR